MESLISSDMLLARLFSNSVRWTAACASRRLSRTSPGESDASPAELAGNERKEDSNAWLWSYLRDRKSFVELNDEQKRRVIDIGATERDATLADRSIDVLLL